MMGQIQAYFLLSACFSLLFISAFFLLERYKKRRDFGAKHTRISEKIPWDSITKILCLWMGILVLKKLIYFVPLIGIIQTTSSVWWGDRKVLSFLIIFIFILYVLGINTIKNKRELTAPTTLVFLVVYSAVMLLFFEFFILPDVKIESSPFEYRVFLIIFAPLLELKMLCSGKYLGLLTSFLLSYFIVAGYKKLPAKILRSDTKLAIVPGLMALTFLVFIFYQFLGTSDWEKPFYYKVQSVQKVKELEELQEAANSIVDKKTKSNALNSLALAIAKTGDIRWAAAIAEKIPDIKTKNSTLKQIREGIEKK